MRWFDPVLAFGTKGSEVELHTHGDGKLALPDATGNSVKVGYWDVDWVDDGTHGPANSGDQIAFDGSLDIFKITINGKPAIRVNA